MIAVIDYGAGNIGSVLKAFEFLGADVKLTSDKGEILNADAAVLPGVGSFGDAVSNLRERNLEETINKFVKSGKPFLGICVGLQLLFESSEESPEAKGLSILKGKILKIPKNDDIKVPHMGWNSLEFDKNCGLFSGLEENPYVYFVHSYYLKAEEDIVSAKTFYGTEIHAAVQKGNVSAMQFHPEKSGEIGLKILKNFIESVV